MGLELEFPECEDCLCAQCFNKEYPCLACVLCNVYQRYPTYGDNECPEEQGYFPKLPE